MQVSEPRPAGPAERRAFPQEAGCWISGHRGQYAILDLLEIAESWGWDGPERLAYGTYEAEQADPPWERDLEFEVVAADAAERWMNEQVAPEGYAFGWEDGEFYLMPMKWWREDS